MRRLAAIFMALTILLLTSTSAFALVDVEARYWFTEMDGNVMATGGSLGGTNVGFVNDLGIDNSENFAEGRITLELGNHKIRYGYMPLSWSGTRTLSQDINFAGQTYSASSSVTTDIKLDLHRLAYEYDFIDLLNNRLGIIAELKYIDARVNLKDAALGLDEQQSIAIPIPTVGVSAQVGLPFLFNVGGEVTGMSLGSKAYLVDAEAMVNFKPAPFVVIAGGYRYMKFHVEKGDDEIDFTLKGPFITLKADF
ncbi:MAG: hypothetical protein BMS9Abin23_0733 [Thermodesulfobacteriota bacterium]|nr:MAG: hypothetical protein BMS9Abin23_0733 [Thermodesulfobacteriota bacterium]